MTLKEYFDLVGDRNLVDRYKNSPELLKPKKSFKTVSTDKNDLMNSQLEKSTVIRVPKPKILVKSRTRNSQRRILPHKITSKIEEAVNLLTRNPVKETKFRANKHFNGTPAMMGTNSEYLKTKFTTPKAMYQDFIGSHIGRRNISTANQGFRTTRSLRSTIGSTSSSVGQRIMTSQQSTRKTNMKRFEDYKNGLNNLLGSSPRVLTARARSRCKTKRNINFIETLRSMD